MHIRTLIAGFALTTAGLAGPVLADGHRDSGREAFYDYAKVTDVEPIYREIPISTRVRECRNERRVHHRHGSHSYTPAIVGGIVGGVVGNQFGRGRGKTVLTVAGAALGASVGHDLERRRGLRHVGRRHADCSTFERIHYERELQGYRVHYRYQGQRFTTVTQEHPGRRMRLRVAVAPVGDRYAELGGDYASCETHRGDDHCDDY